MYRLFLLIAVLSLSGAFSGYGQADFFRSEKKSLDTAEIKAGRHLEQAQTFSLREFVKYYIIYGEEGQSKKWGNLQLEQLYGDTAFTWFGRVAPGGRLVKFFKVRSQDLATVDYRSLEYSTLTERFLTEIFPAEDRKILGRKGLNNCWTAGETFDFIYLPDKKQVEIVYDWTVDCNYRFKKLKKHYTARYDLASKQFVK